VTAPAAARLPAQPFIDGDWLRSHAGQLAHLALQHVELTAIAVAAGIVIAFPLAVASFRHGRLYGPVSAVTGLLYTIPALALFAFLVPYTGLTVLTAEIGLVSYTLLILVRNTVAGLAGVPEDVREAARGMGYTSRQLFWQVEVPLALPVIVAGVRIATVTTIGLVTVTALIAEGGLGAYILLGIQESFATPALAAAAGSVLLAVAADLLLLGLQQALTPWARRRGGEAGRVELPKLAAVPVKGG
jgi:osmoprotectant transport system permease protein